MLENLHLEAIRIIGGICGTSHQKLYKKSDPDSEHDVPQNYTRPLSPVYVTSFSPFLIGRMFVREPSWKYGVHIASLNMFWDHRTDIISDWLRAELSCGWRTNKNKNGWLFVHIWLTLLSENS